MMTESPIVLVEVEPFTVRARELWSETELEAFQDFIARNPLAGSLIPGPEVFARCGGRHPDAASAAAPGSSTIFMTMRCRCFCSPHTRRTSLTI